MTRPIPLNRNAQIHLPDGRIYGPLTHGFIDYETHDWCKKCHLPQPKKVDRVLQRCPVCREWMRQHPRNKAGRERLRRIFGEWEGA